MATMGALLFPWTPSGGMLSLTVTFLFDQWTDRAQLVSTRPAPQQELKLPAQQLEFTDLGIQIGEMVAGQRFYFRAGSLTPRRQLYEPFYSLSVIPRAWRDARS